MLGGGVEITGGAVEVVFVDVFCGLLDVLFEGDAAEAVPDEDAAAELVEPEGAGSKLMLIFGLEPPFFS